MLVHTASRRRHFISAMRGGQNRLVDGAGDGRLQFSSGIGGRRKFGILARNEDDHDVGHPVDPS